jgi:hypothetical protein
VVRSGSSCFQTRAQRCVDIKKSKIQTPVFLNIFSDCSPPYWYGITKLWSNSRNCVRPHGLFKYLYREPAPRCKEDCHRELSCTVPPSRWHGRLARDSPCHLVSACGRALPAVETGRSATAATFFPLCSSDSGAAIMVGIPVGVMVPIWVGALCGSCSGGWDVRTLLSHCVRLGEARDREGGLLGCT